MVFVQMLTGNSRPQMIREFQKQREEEEARFDADRKALQEKLDSKTVDDEEREKLSEQIEQMQVCHKPREADSDTTGNRTHECKHSLVYI